MDDDVIDRSLSNLARSDRADHIPKIGLILAIIVANVTYIYCWVQDYGTTISLLAAAGTLVTVACAFVLIAWPLVRHRHHKLMRERTLFLFPPHKDTTRHALRRLRRLNEGITADPALGRLLERWRNMPEYHQLFEQATQEQRKKQRAEHLAEQYPRGGSSASRRAEEVKPLAVMRPRASVPRPEELIAPPHPDGDADLALDIDRTAQLQAMGQERTASERSGDQDIPLELPEDQQR